MYQAQNKTLSHPESHFEAVKKNNAVKKNKVTISPETHVNWMLRFEFH